MLGTRDFSCICAFAIALTLGCGRSNSAEKAGDTHAPKPIVPTAIAASDPPALSSWRDGPAKRAILDFVARIRREGTADFVPIKERIAVFDNDGTLWSEQPMPVQLVFAIDRVKALSPQHPEWKDRAPFKAVLAGDRAALERSSEQEILELITATHSGMTSNDFAETASSWLTTARDPRFRRPYTDLVYQPMLEVLGYLRANGFKTFIVSGGGTEFMRAISERTYGVPPEQVIGSSGKLRYESSSTSPKLRRLPEADLVDDKAGKPVGIQKFIGRRPILAFGNSDGDFEMLEWTTAGARGPRLAVLVHHTDAEREWAYDRNTSSGRLSRALDEAPRRGWVLVDMKRDWSVIYPFQRGAPN